LPGQRVGCVDIGQALEARQIVVAIALGIADGGVITQKWREDSRALGRQAAPNAIHAANRCRMDGAAPRIRAARLQLGATDWAGETKHAGRHDWIKL
jgi:hypothetical protein